MATAPWNGSTFCCSRVSGRSRATDSLSAMYTEPLPTTIARGDAASSNSSMRRIVPASSVTTRPSGSAA